MSKKYDETDKHKVSNRNDDLLAEYLDGMFDDNRLSRPVDVHEGSVAVKLAEDNTASKGGADTKQQGPKRQSYSQSKLEEELSFSEEHKNSKPAGRVFKVNPVNSRLEVSPAKEFKPAELRKDKVLPALMPKLKPATVEVSKLSITLDETEQLAQAKHTELAADTKIDIPVSAADEKSVDKGEAETKDHESDLEAAKDSKIQDFKSCSEFEALLFEVRGLQLAVPLVTLGSIHRIDEAPTHIVGRADWYLGMLRENGRNLQIVDTARWVMPSKAGAKETGDYEYVIRLGDSDWALACNNVKQAITLQQDEVKWRSDSSKRPWLAGTVVSHMCALLDVENMAELLDANKLHVSN